jgi:hypothetical protein
VSPQTIGKLLTGGGDGGGDRRDVPHAFSVGVNPARLSEEYLSAASLLEPGARRPRLVGANGVKKTVR